ncbi:hypothetical protein HYW60_00090 [Candidatus Kaiserbacteria bacterium]|nr:hypothetical protein [Candidatus Kaiserbacteria bacterium]
MAKTESRVQLRESDPAPAFELQGTRADTLNFSVNKLTPEELELTYMDRGGVLRFTKVQ